MNICISAAVGSVRGVRVPVFQCGSGCDIVPVTESWCRSVRLSDWSEGGRLRLKADA